MGKINLLLGGLIMIATYLIIYRALFLNASIAWGDSPFLYPEAMGNFLFQKPSLWNFKDDNFGSSQASSLWLYLPNLVHGTLSKVANLQGDLVTKAAFYFPATILPIIGSWLLTGLFTKNILVRLIGVFFYSFNPYLLLLIDGGQVGMALSYAIFPFTVFCFKNLLLKTNLRNYGFSLLAFFLLSNTDIRVFALAIILVLLWMIIESLVSNSYKSFLKKIWLFPAILIPVIILDSFWLVPTVLSILAGGFESTGVGNLGLNTVSLIHSFLLYPPHFPLNEYGNRVPPPFYSAFLPILILFGLLIDVYQKNRVRIRIYLPIFFLYLVFSFLSKGESKPWGEFYSFLVNNFPLGVSLRDSTKFFTPLLISVMILLVLAVDTLINQFSKAKTLICICILGYLLLLIHPALFGGLTGALGNRVANNGFEYIHQRLADERGFFRTLWFPERPPKAYYDWEKPALSANRLYLDRPFASMIDGDYDLFNFLHSPQLNQWFELLGIKYAFFPENERKKTWSERDRIERGQFLEFIKNVFEDKDLNWPISFPAFVTGQVKPHIFAQEKAIFVLGGEEIYQTLVKNDNFRLSAQGILFLEDGQLNPRTLLTINPDSGLILLANRQREDLRYLFLQGKMISPSSSTHAQWAIKSSSDYLSWKYEMLKNGIRNYDFDFKKGIAFSSLKDESIDFDISVPADGDYYLAVRSLGNSSSLGLSVSFLNQLEEITFQDPQHFNWQLLGPFHSSRGIHKLRITNRGGFNVLNSIALVNDKELTYSTSQAGTLLKRFPVISLNQSGGKINFNPQLLSKSVNTQYSMLNPTQYTVTIPQKVRWLVFSDHFNKEWYLKSADIKEVSLPFYSFINGFYLPDNLEGQRVTLFLAPQRSVDLGIYISLGGATILMFVVVFLSLTRHER